MVAAARIEIVPYDSAWPARFESEKSVLLDVFRSVSVQVEHVGSTAVPGLGAKPVIDIMLGVDHLADVEARIPDLAARGYEYVRRYAATSTSPPCTFTSYFSTLQSTSSGETPLVTS